MRNFLTKTFIELSGMMLGAVMLLLSVITVSPAQPLVTPPDTASAINSTTLQVKASFITGAYLMVKYGPLKPVEGSSPDNATFTASVSIQGIPGETSVMTCSVESGQHQNQDCNGSEQTVSHPMVGEHSFDNGIKLKRDFLQDSQQKSGGSVSIDLTYI